MSLGADVHINAQRYVFLAPLTIGAAVAATATTPVTKLAGAAHCQVQAVFLYGAGGTTTNAYFQTSLDGGLTWIDIMNFSFTTAAATKVSATSIEVAPAAQAFAPSDGGLTANTVVNGVMGDRFRLKYVTTGTYTGATSLAVYGIVRG